MLNLGASLLSHINTLLSLKALPDEAALQGYIRSAFKGIAVLVTGSVLLGVSISAAIYIAYEQMLSYGYNKLYVQIITVSMTLLLVAVCFVFADKWLSRRFCKKPDLINSIDNKVNYVKDITGETIRGFVEGLFYHSKDRS